MGNFKTSAFLVFLALVACLGVVIFVGSRDLEGRVADDNNDHSVRTVAEGPELDAVQRPDGSNGGSEELDEEMHSTYLSDDTDSIGPSSESSEVTLLPESDLVRGAALDPARVMALLSAGEFDGFVASLRDSANQVGSQKRVEFESVLYSRPEVLEGGVLIRSLECGGVVCAAEFAGADVETLDAFVTQLISDDDFNAGTMIQLPPNRNDSITHSIQVVFSHDPSIVGATLAFPTGDLTE